MGTKNNPGKFDCYDKAQPDEPLFTLLGRDPQGSDLVSLWAALRAKDINGAERIYHRMAARAMQIQPKRGDPDKVAEAVNCADAMRTYFHKTRLGD